MTNYSRLLTIILALCTISGFAQNTEIVSLRSINSKTYLLPSGDKQATIHGEPIHFFNGVSWHEIDPSITATSSTLYNATNVISSVFPRQPNNASSISFTVDGHLIEMSMQKEIVKFSNGITTLSTLNNWSQADYTSDNIIYTEINFGVRDVYQISNGQIKNDLL